MQAYLDFTQYPQIPGSAPRDTSEAAADAIRERASTLRDKALKLLQQEQLTADEVAARLDQSILAIRPRITELAKQDLIIDSGDRRPNASGRHAIVWKAV